MELYLVVRYFGMLIIALYACKKILNTQDISKLKISAAFVFSVMIAVLMSYTPLLYMLIFTASICIFVGFMAKVEISHLITAVVISIGISVGIEILSTIILTLILTLIFMAIELVWAIGYDDPTNHIFLFGLNDMYDHFLLWDSIVVVVSIIFTSVLFRIKRLKKGFVFMQNKAARLFGVILGIIIIVSRSTFGIIGQLSNIEGTDDALEIAPLVFTMFAVILICALGIFFWWRHNTTKVYHQRLQERIIQEYQAEIEEKDRQIKILSQSNELLAAAIHRDNKLIPAMYNAVSEFLYNETKRSGANILYELDEIMQERKDMVLKIQEANKPLPSTGMERIDNILNYMFMKATENEIQFDFVMGGIIKDIAEKVIPKQKLETLLADLIENAIIATSCSSTKKVLVTLGIVDNHFEITVLDSGIPFEIETLTDLGLKKTTTHADNGGSGIGYVAIFSILNERCASLIISEQELQNYTFSKSIKVRFDGKSELIIHSHRAEEIKLLANRKDMFVFECHSPNFAHL